MFRAVEYMLGWKLQDIRVSFKRLQIAMHIRVGVLTRLSIANKRESGNYVTDFLYFSRLRASGIQ